MQPIITRSVPVSLTLTQTLTLALTLTLTLKPHPTLYLANSSPRPSEATSTPRVFIPPAGMYCLHDVWVVSVTERKIKILSVSQHITLVFVCLRFSCSFTAVLFCDTNHFLKSVSYVLQRSFDTSYGRGPTPDTQRGGGGYTTA